jgi:hypothetical protein
MRTRSEPASCLPPAAFGFLAFLAAAAPAFAIFLAMATS